MKQVTDVGNIIGLLDGRSIFDWLEFDDGHRYQYDRVETDLSKVKPDEVFLPPGLIYKKSSKESAAIRVQ